MYSNIIIVRTKDSAVTLASYAKFTAIHYGISGISKQLILRNNSQNSSSLTTSYTSVLYITLFENKR